MASVVENLGGLKRRLTITVPAESVDQAFNVRLKNLAKKAKIKGFRAGKVPTQVFEKKHGKEVYREVTQELLQSHFEEATKEHHLKIVGHFDRPKVLQGAERGQALQCYFDLEIYPELSLEIPTGEEITRFSAVITDADIDERIEDLRKENVTWKPVERAAQMGDSVLIDFEGSIDGVAFAEGSVKDFEFQVEEEAEILPEFKSNLVGMTAGEEKDITARLPEGYLNKDYAGKEALFKVTVKTVMEPELPPIDDAFLAKWEIQPGDFSALREEVREDMQEKLDQVLKNSLKNAVFEKVLNKNHFESPDGLIAVEIGYLKQKFLNKIKAMVHVSEKELANITLPAAVYTTVAKKRVELGLILGELVKHYNIKVDTQEVRKKVQEMVASAEDPEAVEHWVYQSKDLIQEIHTMLIEDRTVENLLKEFQVKDENISYKKAMEQGQLQEEYL